MDLWDLLWPVGDRPASDCPYRAVAVVGAGGKTTLLDRVAREAAAVGSGALLAVTTKWWNPPGFFEARHITVDAVADRTATPHPAEVHPSHPSHPPIVAISGPPTAAGEKVAGVEPGRLLDVALGMCADTAQTRLGPVPLFPFPVVIEADGARGRSFKVAGADEPVIPPWVGTVVCVTALPALGGKPTDELVHRMEAFWRLTGGTPPGAATISPEVVALLLCHAEGMFKGAPAGVRRIWIINQADSDADVDRAAAFATAVLGLVRAAEPATYTGRGAGAPGPAGTPQRAAWAQTAAAPGASAVSPVDTVAVASLQSDDPVRHVVASVGAHKAGT